MEKTVTVAGHFGDKQMSRKDFVQRWSAQAVEFYAIAHSENDMRMVRQMHWNACELAGKEWDRLYALQAGQRLMSA